MKLRKITNIITFWVNKFVWFVFQVKTKVVKCLIKNDQDEVLLVRLTYGPAVWKLPGGIVDRKEDIQVAVAREVEEELGFSPKALKLVGEEPGQGKRNNSTIYYFSAKVERQIVLQLDPVEIREAKWFSLDNLPKDRAGQVDTALKMSQEPI